MTANSDYDSRFFPLDSLDVAIIAELQRDGRKPLSELGKQMGVSHGTVRNRIERLRAEGILKIKAVVDPGTVGFPTQVWIGINADLTSMSTLPKQLAKLPEVVYVASLTGRFDAVISAVFASSDHLRRFLVDRLSKVRGIRSTETFHILSPAKRGWDWEVPILQASKKSRQPKHQTGSRAPSARST